jgi:hypothetical protein
MRSASLLALLAACTPDAESASPRDGGDTAGASGDSAGAPGDASLTGDSAIPTWGDAPSPTGSILLTLTADRGAAADAVVSLGVPFPPGALTDATLVRLRNPGGAEVAAWTASLATWPLDGSVRSLLLAFRTSLAEDASAVFTIDYGAAPASRSAVLAANPDGPIAATLPAAWYAASRVIGYHVPAAANTAFPEWEDGIEDYLADMDPAWETYGLSCSNTSAERSYYDGPHALFQRFIHHATPATYRRAREEALWYRANELDWYDGNTIALYACESGWDPTEPIAWGSLRRMLGQGMLDDWLLTGDPTARAALAGLGEAFLQNLTALTTGGEITVLVTERNMAWPMMGLASYYAIEPRPDVAQALGTLVGMTADWQALSGAFEHDIVRPDPEECTDGPNGASPFMTSLLIDGLMDAYLLTNDARIPPTVLASAAWFRDDALTSDGEAFQYLWGCVDGETEHDYTVRDSSDLNLLISHVFGAAFYLSSDEAWLTFGDEMAGYGVRDLYAGRPKQWSQSTRTFIKYMGYRALAREP